MQLADWIAFVIGCGALILLLGGCASVAGYLQSDAAVWIDVITPAVDVLSIIP